MAYHTPHNIHTHVHTFIHFRADCGMTSLTSDPQGDTDELTPYGDGDGYEQDYLAADLGNTLTFQDYSSEEDHNSRNNYSSTSSEDDDVDDADLEDLGDDGNGIVTGEEVPSYACAYCGIHSPDSVAQCVETGKWFCNARLNNNSSCIVQHLVRAKKHTVRLHEDGPLGDSTIECYNCGSANVFDIGSLPTQGQDVVVLLCRNCLGETEELKKQGWEVDRWSALIQDKEFVEWLLKIPSEKEQMRARQVTAAQIRKLEDIWRENPDVTMEDIKHGEQQDDGPNPVQGKYEDAYEYQNIFGPLVKLEADEDKKMKEAHRAGIEPARVAAAGTCVHVRTQIMRSPSSSFLIQ